MKNKLLFVLISVVFVLLCACTVLGVSWYRTSTTEFIKQDISSEASEAESSSGAQTDETVREKININTATKEQLIALPEIGEVIAQRIIDYRNEYGGFDTISEIKNVKGIGDAKFNKIKDMITV